MGCYLRVKTGYINLLHSCGRQLTGYYLQRVVLCRLRGLRSQDEKKIKCYFSLDVAANHIFPVLEEFAGGSVVVSSLLWVLSKAEYGGRDFFVKR